MARAAYDRIGTGYAARRRPDPRIAARIEEALGDAASVVNVGAGTGSYEPAGRKVVAVEPSATMIGQRSPGAAPVVMASAERLPFDDDSFDAAMAVLTVHHWSDKAGGLREMRRVARRTVAVLTYDPAHPGCWLNEYFPALRALDEEQMPPIAFYEQVLGPVDVTSVPVPGDCSDGFLYAFWRPPRGLPRSRRPFGKFIVVEDPRHRKRASKARCRSRLRRMAPPKRTRARTAGTRSRLSPRSFPPLMHNGHACRPIRGSDRVNLDLAQGGAEEFDQELELFRLPPSEEVHDA